MNDLYVGPEIEVPVIAEISLKLINAGMNDSTKVKRKKYIYSKLEVHFDTIRGDSRTWSEQCLDAVANFIAQTDIWKNRVRIIEAEFNDKRTIGTVRIECYLWEKLCSM